MYFCIRDDDTSFFTSPDQLEYAYSEVSKWGPISLAVVPFHRAGTSKGVPEKFRGQWSVHALHENRPLVSYLRDGICKGRFEVMLHGYYHDEPDIVAEFGRGDNLMQRIVHGRKYLEDLLGTAIRVFVPPHNTIGRQGLAALAHAELHLGCTAGLRAGWSPLSWKTWQVWSQLRTWRKSGRLGIPWILDLGDHREIAGNPVTPSSSMQENEVRFDSALEIGGVFCAATHYWELSAGSVHMGDPTVGEQLCHLIARARSNSSVVWRSVGETIANNALVI